jgi:hypothetical protein
MLLRYLEYYAIKYLYGIYAMGVMGYFMYQFTAHTHDNNIKWHEVLAHLIFILTLSHIFRRIEEDDVQAQSSLFPSHSAVFETIGLYLMICFCCVSFLFGLLSGKNGLKLTNNKGNKNSASNIASSVETASVNSNSSTTKIKRKIKLKPKEEAIDSNSNSDISEQVTPSDSMSSMSTTSPLTSAARLASAMESPRTLEQSTTNTATREGEGYEILRRSPSDDHLLLVPCPSQVNSKEYDLFHDEIIAESRASLVALCQGTTDNVRNWHVVRSEIDNNSHFWMSKSSVDGILLRGKTRVAVPYIVLLKWLLEYYPTGIEGIASKPPVIMQGYHQGTILVRRIVSNKSGGYLSSKREFIVITSNFRYNDGSFVIASRSTDDVLGRPPPAGYVRGKVYTSGYVLKTINTSDGPLTEVSYGCHIHMMSTYQGSSADKMNESKAEELTCSVLSIFDKINDSSTFEHYMASPQSTPSVSSNVLVGTPVEITSTTPSHNSDSNEHVSSMDTLPSPVSDQNGLRREQVSQLLQVGKDAANKLRVLHQSQMTNSIVGSEGGVAGSSSWDKFYDQDGVSVSELVDTNAPIGILSAFTSTDAPPSVVRRLLVDQPEIVDALLIGRSVLTNLDKNTYVQWLGYGAIWPVGSRDFLIVTTEENYVANNADNSDENAGFIIVSTSIDNIVEDVDADENADDTYEAYQFTRSKLKLAGYVGIPNSRGGTDVSLFVDVDIYFYTPPFLVKFLAQYGLNEMMKRIKKTTDTGGPSTLAAAITSSISSVFLPNKVVSSVENAEDALSKDDNPDFTNRISKSSVHGRRVASRLATIPVPNGQNDGLLIDDSFFSNTTTSNTKGTRRIRSGQASRLPITESSTRKSMTSSETRDSIMRTNDSNDINDTEDSAYVTTDSAVEMDPVVSKGLSVASEALTLFRLYLGIDSDDGGKLGLDWQYKDTKKGVTVSTSMVAGSTWQAIKAHTYIRTNKEKLRSLLTDDSRINEFDDMFDFCQFVVRINDKTSIRRMCFKAIWPTAPRDFAVLTTWAENADGSLFIVSRSAPDDIRGQEKGFVRGTIHISGYYVQPYGCCDSDAELLPEHCKFTLVAHTELGGTLPVSVINMLATAAPLKILSAITAIVK